MKFGRLADIYARAFGIRDGGVGQDIKNMSKDFGTFINGTYYCESTPYPKGIVVYKSTKSSSANAPPKDDRTFAKEQAGGFRGFFTNLLNIYWYSNKR